MVAAANGSLAAPSWDPREGHEPERPERHAGRKIVGGTIAGATLLDRFFILPAVTSAVAEMRESRTPCGEGRIGPGLRGDRERGEATPAEDVELGVENVVSRRRR